MPFTLRPHQLEVVKWAVNRARGFIVARPGRGKTAMALGTLKVLRNAGKVSTAVILTHKRGMDAYRKLTAGLPMVYVESTHDLVQLRSEYEQDPQRVFVLSTGLLTRYKAEFNSKYATENVSEYIGSEDGPEDCPSSPLSPTTLPPPSSNLSTTRTTNPPTTRINTKILSQEIISYTAAGERAVQAPRGLKAVPRPRAVKKPIR